MTLGEYKDKIKEIEDNATQSKTKLQIEYANFHNPYKKGDIVTDHIGSIIIEFWKISVYNKIPSCVYWGLELKKDKTPKKIPTRRDVWQENIIV